MGLGPDNSYNGQSKIYRKQQPDGATFNSASVITEEVLDAGSLLSHYGQESYGGVVEPANATFSISKGGSANLSIVTVQINDGAGHPIASLPVDLDVVLSDAASGVGVTATTASGGVAVTTGTQLTAYIAAKALHAQCNASGVIAITITDTAKTGFYVAVLGLPVPFVSRQLVAADYD